MQCRGCEYRRRVMAIMAQASQEWVKNPAGPNVRAVYERLMREAQERGDFDEVETK